MKKTSFDELISKSLAGEKSAVETLITRIQTSIFNLSVRYLWDPADAEDATQEILLKVLTNLSGFRGESSFNTWVYRIATNYLLNMKRTTMENLTFEDGEKYLKLGATYPAYEQADANLLEEEVKIACSTSMLICVSRPLRLAYLIGEILEFNSKDGAYILEIEPATFRKRLSLARKQIRSFMAKQCGLYNPKNDCRCSHQINYCIEVDWVKPQALRFPHRDQIGKAKEEIESIMNDTAIFHSHPTYKAPNDILDSIRSLINSNQFPHLTTGK